MIQTLLLASSLIGLLSAPCISFGSEAVKVNVAPPGKAEAEPKIEFTNRIYRQGSVTEITKHSITIRCPEWMGHSSVRGQDGKYRWQVVTIPAEPPKRFALSEELASGKVPNGPPDHTAIAFQVFRYRVTDVKVGDWVSIYYSRIDGIDTCTYIHIVKRPGGRIPPLPREVKEKSTIPYHERMQAYWDLEDKGIPYPEKFGHLRRWPVAPLPREILRPPPATPELAQPEAIPHAKP